MDLNLKLKMPKSLRMEIGGEGQIFIAEDNSAFCLKTEYQYKKDKKTGEPVKMRHYDVETLLRLEPMVKILFNDKQINLAAYLVLNTYFSALNKRVANRNFRTATVIKKIFDFEGAINSAKSQLEFKCGGIHSL